MKNIFITLSVIVLGGFLLFATVSIAAKSRQLVPDEITGTLSEINLGRRGHTMSPLPRCNILQNKASLLNPSGEGYAFMATSTGRSVSTSVLDLTKKNENKKWDISTETPASETLQVLRLFDNKKWVFDSNFRPLSWSKDGQTLWVDDNQNRVYKIDMQTGTAKLVENWKFLAKKIRRFKLLSAEDGVLVLGTLNGRYIEFLHLATGHSVASGKLPGRYYEGTIGRTEDTQHPLYFVSWNEVSEYSGLASTPISRGLMVLDASGAEVFRTKINMFNVKYFPSLNEHGVLALAPKNDFRCLWRVDATGAFTTTENSDCKHDVETVVFSETDGVLSTNGLLEHRSTFLHEKNRQQFANLGINLDEIMMIAGNNLDQGIYLQTRNGEAPHLFALKNGKIEQSLDHFCSYQQESFGQSLVLQPVVATTPDAMTVHGFYLEPKKDTKKGVVLSYHGGPYAAWDNLATVHDTTFRGRGYHVIKVNFRGSMGYGINYIQAGWGWAPDKMVDDGIALYEELKRQNKIDENLPVYADGGSWGGMLALKAISSYPNLFSGALIQAMACDFRSKLTSEKMVFYHVERSHLLVDDSINNVSYLYPKKEPSEYNNCDTIIPPHQKVYLIHGKDDAIAPVAAVERFLSQQNEVNVHGIILENIGHEISIDMFLNNRTSKAINFWEAE